MAGLTAVFALPWVPDLQTLRLDREAMVQALGLSLVLATLALALVRAFAGLRLGERLRDWLAGPAFQKALLLVFIALGLANLARLG